MYDASRWRETREARLGEKVASLAFCPDGRRLVAAGELSIRIVDAAEAGEPRKLPQLFGPIRSMALSPDGRWLLAGHADGRVSSWDVDRGESRIVGPPRSGEVLATAFSREGGRAAFAARGEPVSLLKAGEWREENSVALDPEGSCSLAFARDGRTLLCGSGSGAIAAWDVERGPGAVLKGHGGPVVSLAVTPDDAHAVSVSADGTIRIWDWRKGAEQAQLKHEGVRAVAVHPSGRTFASVGADRQLRVWGYVRGGEARVRAKGFGGLSFQKRGAAVSIFSIVPGGPAEQAGLQVGDVVRVVGTKAVKEPSDALEAIGSYGDGEEAVFEIERKGEEKQVRLRLGRRPGQK